MKTKTRKELDKEFSGHMQWEIIQGHFQVIENTREGTIVCPEQYAEYPGNEDAARAYGVGTEDVSTVFGWFSRLSAPGYMDCTEWSGPFNTEEEAAQSLLSLYA